MAMNDETDEPAHALPDDVKVWITDAMLDGLCSQDFAIELLEFLVERFADKHPSDCKAGDEIEAAALALYDELNPDWQREVLVSKDECIRRAREQLAAHERR
jgi:hypothetical protein